MPPHRRPNILEAADCTGQCRTHVLHRGSRVAASEPWHREALLSEWRAELWCIGSLVRQGDTIQGIETIPVYWIGGVMRNYSAVDVTDLGGGIVVLR